MGHLHAPTALLKDKNADIYWTGGWVGLRTGLDLPKIKISCPYRDSNWRCHYKTLWLVCGVLWGQLWLLRPFLQRQQIHTHVLHTLGRNFLETWPNTTERMSFFWKLVSSSHHKEFNVLPGEWFSHRMIIRWLWPDIHQIRTSAIFTCRAR